MALVDAVLGGFGLLVIALMLELTAQAVRRDELPSNQMLGIRTRATRRSPAAWTAGHRAALPLMRVITVQATVTAAAAVLVAFLLGSGPNWAETAVLTLLVGGYLITVGLLIRLTRVADTAARRAP
ncbi:MAG TPA: SdpI family protein [Kineosporiaceae bacterium]|nr:SdpI family protein [Kineosporiaceae bacterium]